MSATIRKWAAKVSPGRHRSAVGGAPSSNGCGFGVGAQHLLYGGEEGRIVPARLLHDASALGQGAIECRLEDGARAREIARAGGARRGR